MVSSAMPSSSSTSSTWPTLRSWSIIVSWYGDCHRPAWPTALRLGVGERVHVREVAPDEERRARGVLALDVIDRDVDDLVVDGLHPLLVQRPGVFDGLLADRPVLRVIRFGGHLGGGLACEHPARMRQLVEQRELVLVRIVRLLRFFLGVEVIEVAEELVEPVHRRQVLVQVAEVVLAELAGGVAERLEQFGDRRILSGPADVGAGYTDLAHPGAVHALPADERGAARRAALLAVGIGEPHALVGDAVDVRRAIAHQAVAVTTQIADPDVVAPEHQDVRLTVRHEFHPFEEVRILLTYSSPAVSSAGRSPGTDRCWPSRTLHHCDRCRHSPAAAATREPRAAARTAEAARWRDECALFEATRTSAPSARRWTAS